jgi:hypothetical protein
MSYFGEDLPDFIVGVDFGQTYTGKSILFSGPRWGGQDSFEA